MLPTFHIALLGVLWRRCSCCLTSTCWQAPEGNDPHLAPALVGALGQIPGKAVQSIHPPRSLGPTKEGYGWGKGWGCPLVRPCSTSCSAPGTFFSGSLNSRNGHGCLAGPWWWTSSAFQSSPPMWQQLLGPFDGPPLPQQGLSWLKCPISSSVGSCFSMAKCQQVLTLPVPLAALLLSTSGSFSRKTPHPWLVCFFIWAHMVGTPAIFKACTPGGTGLWSPPYWSRAPLCAQQRHPSAGLDVEGHASSLGRSYILPPFFLNEWLGGTSLGGSGTSATPVPPNVGTHPRTFWHPYAAPFLGWTDPPYLLAPWWWWFSFFYLCTIAPANHDN